MPNIPCHASYISVVICIYLSGSGYLKKRWDSGTLGHQKPKPIPFNGLTCPTVVWDTIEKKVSGTVGQQGLSPVCSMVYLVPLGLGHFGTLLEKKVSGTVGQQGLSLICSMV